MAGPGRECGTLRARRNGGSATATVTVTVTPVNDPPDAVNDTFVVAESSTDTARTLSSGASSGSGVAGGCGGLSCTASVNASVLP